jgi:hypothetical protein
MVQKQKIDKKEINMLRSAYPVRSMLWLAVLSLAFVSIGASQELLLDAQAVSKGIVDHLNVETASIQELTLPAEEGVEFLMDVELGGVRHTLKLYPYSIRSWDFKLLVQDETGALIETPAPAPRTYAGSVLGVPDSEVVGSLKDGSLSATIRLGRHALWVVQPLSDAVEGAAPSRHVVYNGDDSIGGDWTCGTNESHRHEEEECTCSGGGDGYFTAGTGLKICEIAFDSDYEFYTKNGSSVSNTLADIEKVVNGMRTVYERDVAITFEVTTVIVRTAEPDPYTTNNPDDLLNQFKNYWFNNLKKIKRDTAHLMTGKNLQGSTIGIAYLGVICYKATAFGVSQSRFTTNLKQRTALTSHEVGHNWNAQHCTGSTCHIMCAGLGGCGGIGAPEFGPTSITKIGNFKNSRACLDDLGDPIALPFADLFTSMDVDLDKWSNVNDATVDAGGMNPPSAPYALNLDATGAEAYADDEIRSNFILLGGQSGVTFSYHTQHRGVESGEALVVTYLASDMTWQEINRVTSDGVDQTSFDFHSHTLPGNAYHDQFRVRFQTEVDEVGDSWYVDNVFVGYPGTSPLVSALDPKAGPEAGGTTVTVTGVNLSAPLSVRIGGTECSGVNVLNSTTATCQAPAGTNGWSDVEISGIFGNDSLPGGFRYFPVGNQPFNGTDIPTDSVNGPVASQLIVSGKAGNPYLLFLSYGGGPLPTPYGNAGLTPPVVFLVSSSLGPQGYSLLPLFLPSGLGPLDFYIHALGLDNVGNVLWSYGGNNPNGTGSVWYHLNN